MACKGRHRLRKMRSGGKMKKTYRNGGKYSTRRVEPIDDPLSGYHYMPDGTLMRNEDHLGVFQDGTRIPQQNAKRLSSDAIEVNANPQGHGFPGGDVPIRNGNTELGLIENDEVVRSSPITGDIEIDSNESGHADITRNIEEAKGKMENLLDNIKLNPKQRFNLKSAIKDLDMAAENTFAQQEASKPIDNVQPPIPPEQQGGLPAFQEGGFLSGLFGGEGGFFSNLFGKGDTGFDSELDNPFLANDPFSGGLDIPTLGSNKKRDPLNLTLDTPNIDLSNNNIGFTPTSPTILDKTKYPNIYPTDDTTYGLDKSEYPNIYGDLDSKNAQDEDLIKTDKDKLKLGDLTPLVDNLVAEMIRRREPDLPEPRLEREVDLITKQNVQPQLAAIASQTGAFNTGVDNTISSPAVANRLKLANFANNLAAKNQLLGAKENVEAERINRESLLNQQINTRNRATLDDFALNQFTQQINKNEALQQNINNLVEDVQDIRTKEGLEQRDLDLLITEMEKSGDLGQYAPILPAVEGRLTASQKQRVIDNFRRNGRNADIKKLKGRAAWQDLDYYGN